MTDLATLKIVVDASGAVRVVDGFGNAVQTAAKKTETLKDAAKRTATVLGGFAAATLALVIKNTDAAQRAQAQLANTLRVTGESAGQSLKQLNDHAAALQKITTFGDDGINRAQARLLSYTGIVGNEFRRATEVVLDYATSFEVDLVQAAEAVGKALNFPTQGLGLLSKQGFIFTEVQKQQIKYFEDTNQLAKAQGIILAELESVTQGAAAAYRDTLGGALKGLVESFGDLFEMDRAKAAPLIDAINFLSDSLGIFIARIALALAKVDEFFAKSNAAILSPLSRLSGGLLGNDGKGSGFDLDTQLQRQTDARRRQIIAEREIKRLEKEREEAEKRRIALRGRGTGVVGPGATPGDEFGALIPAIKGLTAAMLGRTSETVRGISPGVPGAEALARLTQESENERIRRRLAASKAAAMDDIAAQEELARNFRENIQRTLGDFFTEFLREGRLSIRSLFASFSDFGATIIGQTLSRVVTPKIESLTTGQQFGAGAALFVVGQLVESFFGLRDSAEAARRAFAETSRAIADFARYATDAGKDSGTLELERLTRERDRLAREALQRSGFSGFQGGFADAYTYLDQMRKLFGNLLGPQIDALVGQLDELGKAFAANIEVAKKAAEAERRLALARQIESLESFRNSLALSDLSPLSPAQQLAEARRQYDLIYALAQGGDASAIASLPETARAFLEASRQVNASGVRYAEDFAKVTANTEALIAELTRQRDTETEVIDVTGEILTKTTEMVVYAQATLTVQQEGFAGTIAAIEEMSETLDDRLRRLEDAVLEAAS